MSVSVATDLLDMVEAVRIDSPVSFAVGGDELEVEDDQALEDALAEALYRRLYIRPRPIGRRSLRLARRRHLADLSQANQGSGTWEPGWLIDRVEDDGRVAVVKNQLVLWAPPSQVRPRGGRVAAGESCRLQVPGELLEELPGFYGVTGDSDVPWERTGSRLRFYWHLRSEVAADWVEEATAALNAGDIPFRLKVLKNPAHYRRADAGVLYLYSLDEAARDIFQQVYRRLGSGLRPEVPRMTRALAPGLAWAEGPSDGTSFGDHRCRLIAEALVSAFESGAVTAEERLARVAAGFREQGLDPRRPHLAADSQRDIQELSEAVHRPKGRRSVLAETRAEQPRDEAGDDRFEVAIQRLADHLCQQAIWYDDRCSWLSGTRGPIRALDASFYDGAAGVGWFLTQAYRHTGVDEHRRTAAGALHRAVHGALGSLEELTPLSFFTGGLGVAWAASRGATLLGDEGLTRGAGRLLESLVAGVSSESRLTEVPGEPLLDIIGGHAGVVLALLDLHRETGKPRYLVAAESLGEQICWGADRIDDVWSWPNQRLSGIEAERPLTGLSHGAAGVGLALLELFAATHRKAFLTAANGAFAYEDALFDASVGNWPDFREAGEPPAFKTAWCHGAPGIALSRLAAMVIDPRRAAVYESAARAGLETTARGLDEALTEKDFDTCLCHGLSGLVEILLVASDVLKEPQFRRQAVRAMERLVRDDRKLEHRNPSLMLGTAGFGYTLLRSLAPESVPSVLWLGRESHHDGHVST